MSGNRKFVVYSSADGVGAISLTLIVHGASLPVPCIGQKYECPEPEQRPADMPEPGRPTGLTSNGLPTVMMGPTGPGPSGSAAIIEGADVVTGIGNNTTLTPGTAAMGFVSGAPQPYQDVQPAVWSPAQRSSLVTVLTPG